MNKVKTWFNGLSDQWKATLRTAFQTFLGTVLTIGLFLLAKATDWINGGLVDWTQELANAGKLLLLGLVTLFTSIITYVQNRGNLGASYTDVPYDPNEPRDSGQVGYGVVWLIVGILLIIVLFVWLTRNVNV